MREGGRERVGVGKEGGREREGRERERGRREGGGGRLGKEGEREERMKESNIIIFLISLVGKKGSIKQLSIADSMIYVVVSPH